MTDIAHGQAGAPRRRMARDVAFFVALLATALALGAALAHLLELPNKIGLAQEEYFIVQKIYRGWAQLAWLLLVELSSIIAVIGMSRRDRRAFWPALAALGCLAGAQAVFWIFTFPANAATDNWTHAPADWEMLRAQWEYSHAFGAVLQAGAMAALIVAVLRREDC